MRTARLIAIVAFLFAIPFALALRNPSAVYCEALGYNYTVEQVGLDEFGYCTLPGGEKVEAWEFLLGEEGAGHGYCEKAGYESVAISGSQCMRFLLPQCQACVVGGEEVEVTRLMNLTFAETTCGDGHCGFPEDSASCPQDCASGRIDHFCDGAADSVCDPDCEHSGEEDPDCKKASSNAGLLIFGVFLVVLLAAALAYYFLHKKAHKKRKHAKSH